MMKTFEQACDSLSKLSAKHLISGKITIDIRPIALALAVVYEFNYSEVLSKLESMEKQAFLAAKNQGI